MRKFVSLMLMYSLLIMSVSGIVLYIMPHGRVAYWTGWRFLGLDKDQWDSLHTIFGFLMVIFGIWHLVLNWQSIKNYIVGKVGALLSREFLLASVLSAVVVVGSIVNVPPFSSFIALEEAIKNMWPKPRTMPPAPHAELFPLSKVAVMVGLSPEKAVEILKSNGIKVSSVRKTLKDIAVENGITPARIYELFLKASPRKSSLKFQPGSGLGRKSLREVCQQLGLGVQECVDILKRNGVKASPEETIRQIALNNGKLPYEVIQILRGGK